MPHAVDLAARARVERVLLGLELHQPRGVLGETRQHAVATRRKEAGTAPAGHAGERRGPPRLVTSDAKHFERPDNG